MRFEANKAFSHPVLRPSKHDGSSSDYRGAAIQTTVVQIPSDDDQVFMLEAEFLISQGDIEREARDGGAEFGLLVVCPRTSFRKYVRANSPKIAVKLDARDLDEGFEIRPLVVASGEIELFEPYGLHPDLAGRQYTIRAGAPLALDYSHDFDTQPETMGPLFSVFDLIADVDQERGQFDLRIADRAQIAMHPDDYFRLEKARKDASGIVRNAVFVPSLMELLFAALDEPPASERRWYRAIRGHVSSLGVDWEAFKQGSPTCWKLSQMLYKSPLTQLDFLSQ